MPSPPSSRQNRRVAIAVEIERPYPHHQEVFAGIQQYAQEHPHWECTIDQHPTYAQRQRGGQAPAYDGVIARAWPQLQTRLKKLGIPLVNVHFQTHREGLSGVYHDATALGQIAADHLIQRGFRRIGYLWDPNTKQTTAMREAFRQRVLEEDREYSEAELVEDDDTDLKVYIQKETTLRQWIGSLRPPVGLCFQTPHIARMAIQICREKGLHVPHDVSIMTQQNLRAVIEVAPRITSIEDNYKKVGYEAAAMLERVMDGREAPGKVAYIPPQGVHTRESTDCFAVEDPLISEAMRYISANLGQKLRAEDIAYHLSVSVSTLQKRFVRALGRGVADETRRLRLSTVKVMLAEPEHSIAMIAKQTGFASAAVLNHTFRRELDMTPSEYRKRVEG